MNGRKHKDKEAQRRDSPPREEGWLRHQQKVGEAHLSAADGVVAHTRCFQGQNRIPKFGL
jgi:hypothetical protein